MSSHLRRRGSEVRGGKENKSKKRKAKKRESIRSKHSRKMAQEITQILLRIQEEHRGDKNRMTLAVHSVAANNNDSIGLKPLIRKLGYDPREVYADKGYQVPANVSYVHSRGIKDRIQKKAYRNRFLSRVAILFNKLVSKPRWVVERTFGSIKH
ncbi:MAG: transposase [Flavobacteriales bacterium Tduv]